MPLAWKRMALAVDDGEFAPTVDLDGLSMLCAVLFTGLAVHAHDGAGRAKLNAAIDAFIATLPVTGRSKTAPRVAAGTRCSSTYPDRGITACRNPLL